MYALIQYIARLKKETLDNNPGPAPPAKLLRGVQLMIDVNYRGGPGRHVAPSAPI